jgi:tetratricopeptide (TPR) repeat protein
MTRRLRRTPSGNGRMPSQPVDVNDAFDAAVALEQQGDLTGAEESYRTADRLGHAAAPVKLGVLLEEHDDLAGAEQAFRRADDRGDAGGAFHLAWLLQQRGDSDGAEAAYRRAEMRGHPAAAANLRVLRRRRGRRRAATAPPPAATAPPPAAPTPAPTPPTPPAEPETAVHSLPATPAGAAAAATAERAGEPAAAGKRQRGGLLRRTASIVLPVAAFAAAFLIGAATRPASHAASHLAPAANVSDSTVTLSSVAPVPAPARLVPRPPVGKPTKPPATTATAPGG